MREISRDEFATTMDRLYQTTDAGFKGVHERLDRQNGRIGATEVAVGRLDQRVTSVEKEMFHRPRRRAEDGNGRALFDRLAAHKVIVALIVIGLAGVFEGLRHLVPTVLSMVMGAP